MKHLATALGFIALATSPGLAQQASDTCSAAPALTLNTTVNSSSINSSSDIQQTCGIGDALDVWYRFTAPAAGTYTFDCFGMDGLDFTLALFTACGGVALDCSDDLPGDIDPQIILPMSAGQAVRIRIAANFFDEGGFSIRVSGSTGGGGPDNNECDSTTGTGVPIITAGVPLAGTNLGATTSVNIPAAACGTFIGSGGQADVFFRFTPDSSGNFRIDTCSGPALDTVLSIHSACPVSSANLLACNDDAGPTCTAGNNNSAITSLALSSGQTYFIRVAGYSEGTPATGSFTLLVTSLAPPSGACCRGSSCAPSTQSACTGPATRWAGAATVCNPANPAAPCCRADFNQVDGVTVQDIFDYLIAYFTTQPGADSNSDGSVTLQDLFDFLIGYFSGAC